MAEPSNSDPAALYRKLVQNWKLIAEARRLETETVRAEAARLLAKQEVEWQIRLEASEEKTAAITGPDPATHKRVQDLTLELDTIKGGLPYKVFFFLRSPRKAMKEFSKQRKDNRKAAARARLPQ